MPTHYTMTLEAGHFQVTGGNVGMRLGTALGRSVDVETEYTPAVAWLRSCTPAAREHPANDKSVRDALAAARGVRFAEPLYRGRCFTTPPASWREFGPDPSASQQRYNWAGTSVLYLSTSPAGVARERPPADGEALWGQRFKAPAEFELVDTRELEAFTAGVFCVVERQLDEHPALGARVAELVAERFDGMIVPGVRGLPGAQYANVVLFRKGRGEDWWHALADTTEAPREIMVD